MWQVTCSVATGMKRTLPLLAAIAFPCAACGGASPTSPSNVSTYAPAQDPAGATSLTYTKDIQPILAADRGSAAQKAETIKRWVVDFGAAQ